VSANLFFVRQKWMLGTKAKLVCLGYRTGDDAEDLVKSLQKAAERMKSQDPVSALAMNHTAGVTDIFDENGYTLFLATPIKNIVAIIQLELTRQHREARIKQLLCRDSKVYDKEISERGNNGRGLMGSENVHLQLEEALKEALAGFGKKVDSVCSLLKVEAGKITCPCKKTVWMRAGSGKLTRPEAFLAHARRPCLALQKRVAKKTGMSSSEVAKVIEETKAKPKQKAGQSEAKKPNNGHEDEPPPSAPPAPCRPPRPTLKPVSVKQPAPAAAAGPRPPAPPPRSDETALKRSRFLAFGAE
jgi:hypothetical protein